jgi:hypothetical protein
MGAKRALSDSIVKQPSLSVVIPGHREAVDPESRHGLGVCIWIPGSRLRRAPE